MQGESIAEDILGGYHLLLAHDVVKHPSLYRRVYEEVRRRYEDSFIILDNSVVELGDAVGLSMMVEAAKIVKPDCIVIPDVMNDGAATRYRASEFGREYMRELHQDEELNELNIPLMGVIQGKHYDDWIESAFYYYCMPNVSYIGVPRVVTKAVGSRMPLLHSLLRHEYFQGVHLLGFSDNVLDDVCCARMPGVDGIDSAVPIRAALAGIPMTIDQPKDYGSRGHFWETSLEKVYRSVNAITDNVCLVRRWIGETK